MKGHKAMMIGPGLTTQKKWRNVHLSQSLASKFNMTPVFRFFALCSGSSGGFAACSRNLSRGFTAGATSLSSRRLVNILKDL